MIFNWLLLLIPVSLGMHYFFHAGSLLTFVMAIVAIVPLAEWLRRATEQLAHHAGPAIGGLLNVTFGNAAELILALSVLMSGRPEVVKAQITGSIMGNGLLGLGLAIVVGSWGRERQTFKRGRASLLSSLLILAMIALLLPAVFHYTESGTRTGPEVVRRDEQLSLGVSVVLIVVYMANLFYTLLTHRDAFAFDRGEGKASLGQGWRLWKSLAVLVAGTAFMAWEAELVSGALEPSAAALGLSTFFLGVIVLAVVGNAAEYVAAIYFARKNQMGLAMSITIGSTIQVALLLAPLLVIASHFMGQPMNLVFSSPLELFAIAGVTFAVNAISEDGETTWFEGVLLLAVYALLGMAFFLVK